ncbi:unnamed protein product [Nippostrongylus brasiliensis]|uniref:Uncharacterized protein n=1 Tax=Nippostrongylus brasiliensis TaxID=27835 RepID=A0A0N4XS17_NIPBR|nr:unnamed protein product [Nippostrongylus brasiliensis]
MIFNSIRVGLSRLCIAEAAVSSSSTRVLCSASARAPGSEAQSNFDRYTRQSSQPLVDQKKAFQVHHTQKMRDTQYDRYGGGDKYGSSGRGGGYGGGSRGGYDRGSEFFSQCEKVVLQ